MGYNDEYYEKMKKIIQEQDAELQHAASKAEASARGSWQVSPDMERANILYEKTKKYMPTVMKQAGLSGLGVAQSAVLQAQNDHLNRMNALKRERDKAAEAASSDIWAQYEAAARALNDKLSVLETENAKAGVDEIYKGVGDAAAKDEAYRALLSNYADNPQMQLTIDDYAKVYRASVAAADDFLGGYAPSVAAAALDEEAEGEALGFWDGLETNGQTEQFLTEYDALDASIRAEVDRQLKARGAMAVKDVVSELGKRNDDVLVKLAALGVDYTEENGFDYTNADIGKVKALLSDNAVQMSASLRKTLKDDVRVMEGRQQTATEDGWKALFEAMSPDDEALDAEGVKEYLAQLVALEEAKNKGEISEKFYNEHVVPEIDEFAKWQKFLDAEEAKDKEVHAAQMAGKKPIEVDGKKWYVLKSLDDDAEAFMEKNREAANKALGEYGNLYNPNIPDKTIIEVMGVNLMYDETSGKWKYVARTQKPTRQEKYIIHDGRVFALLRPDEKYLDAIGDLGNDVEDGRIVEANGVRLMSIDGSWYVLGSAYK